MNIEKIAWLKLRFVMSFIFLWTFLDKTFGLKFSTNPDSAWIRGGSPTGGFLTFGTHGVLVNFFRSLAGHATIDWLFMLAILFVGLTLLLNRFVLWGAVVGTVLMVLIWLSTFPPTNNPLVDEHIIYAIVLALFAIESKKRRLSLN